MKRLNHTIHYDFQNDTYYRLSPPTGYQQPTYFNGQPLKHFQPNYTGRHYLLRKAQRQSLRSDSFDYSEKEILSQNAIINQQKKHHFLDQQPAAKMPAIVTTKLLEKSVPYSPNSLHSKPDNPQTSPRLLQVHKAVKLVRDKKLDELLPQIKIESEPNTPGSTSPARIDLFSETLRSYSKLLRQKPIQNRSPKHCSVPGSDPIKDPSSIFCTTVASFKVKFPENERQSAIFHANPPYQRKRESNSSKKRRIIQQREVFLKFHPQNKEKDEKSVLIQKERKKNLKLLEQIFIGSMNRATKRAYQSLA